MPLKPKPKPPPPGDPPYPKRPWPPADGARMGTPSPLKRLESYRVTHPILSHTKQVSPISPGPRPRPRQGPHPILTPPTDLHIPHHPIHLCLFENYFVSLLLTALGVCVAIFLRLRACIAGARVTWASYLLFIPLPCLARLPLIESVSLLSSSLESPSPSTASSDASAQLLAAPRR